MSSLKRLNNLPQVELVEKEIDGYFVYTASGFCWEEDGCHTRAFDTLKDAWSDRDLIKHCSGEQGCCTRRKY